PRVGRWRAVPVPAPRRSLAAAGPLLPPVSPRRPFLRAAAVTAPLPLAARLALLLPRAVHRLELFFRERALQLLLQRPERRRPRGPARATRDDEPHRTIQRRNFRFRQLARQLLGEAQP